MLGGELGVEIKCPMRIHVVVLLTETAEQFGVDSGRVTLSIDDDIDQVFYLCSRLHPGGCGDGFHVLDKRFNELGPILETDGQEKIFVYVEKPKELLKYELERRLMDDAELLKGNFDLIPRGRALRRQR